MHPLVGIWLAGFCLRCRGFAGFSERRVVGHVFISNGMVARMSHKFTRVVKHNVAK